MGKWFAVHPKALSDRVLAEAIKCAGSAYILGKWAFVGRPVLNCAHGWACAQTAVALEEGPHSKRAAATKTDNAN